VNGFWSTWQDVRFSLGQIRRAPGFAVSAVLTLALGTGANTGIFSIVNGYFRPLEVPEPDRIVVIAAEMPDDEAGFRIRLSYPALNDYRQATDVFSDVFAFGTGNSGLTADGRTVTFQFQAVTGNFFTGLQLPPFIGRVFEPGEGERHGTEATVVLGYEFWQRRFGGDAAIVGRIVRIDGVPTRVIGVTPAGFHGVYQGAEMEGYVPLRSLRWVGARPEGLFVDRSLRYLRVMARLRPEVTVPAAQAAVDVIARRLQQTHPEERDVTARVIPETMARPFPMRLLLRVWPIMRATMFGLAALVLLIACMNVANLLLVRAAVRQREMAMRAALGAGRARLVRLLLVESLLLAITGTGVGLLLARLATGLFAGSIDITTDTRLHFDFDYDWRVFLYAVAVTAATGVVMGLVPALRASRADVRALLDGGHGSAGAGRQRLRGAMVVVQVSGALVLLVVAGLCVRSVQRAQSVDLGFDPSNVLTVRLDPHLIGYDESRTAAFYDELERRLAILPGVESLSLSYGVPMGYFIGSAAVAKEGALLPAGEPQTEITCNMITPRYFETLRIPILHGRGITAQDTAASRHVVVVNETLARQFWPAEDPIGKRLVIPRKEGRLWEVVGVARDNKYLAVFEGSMPHVYLAMRQSPYYLRVVSLRTTAVPESLARLLEREIHALDPEMPISDLKTLRQLVAAGPGFLLFRLGAIQAGAMGLLGLLLAVVGVYGVVSYGASLRTREMGIRIALGAAPSAVRALVLRQGAVLVIAGIVCGLVAAAGVTRALSRLFFLAGSTELPTFAAVASLLGAIALVACYLPARRAMRVDPMVALRHD